MSEGQVIPKKLSEKEKIFQTALRKLKHFNKRELQQFLEWNGCLHKHTTPCGMDSICKDCGDWV